MGGNKNGVQAQIKRDSGIKETTTANTDRNAAPGIDARGRRSAAEQETRPKTYTDTHTTATPPPERKETRPSSREEPERVRVVLYVVFNLRRVVAA